MTLPDDDYSCLECWHTPEEPFVTTWEAQTWQEGYQRGRYEGLEEGHYLGVKAVCRDLLFALHCWHIDLRLGLHGDPRPEEVLHEMARLVEIRRGGSMRQGPEGGEVRDATRGAHACRVAAASPPGAR
jgi:hypothetical protein